MKIYMAGKIWKNDWRHDLVPDLRAATTLSDLPDHRYYSSVPVPRIAFKINEHDLTYVGPFFTCCDHGCAHGRGDHGNSVARNNVCGEKIWGDKHDATASARTEVFDRCIESIRACDLLFTWLDQRDAFGTLVEIGMAHALKKNVFIASPEGFDPDDFWFAGQTGSCGWTGPGIFHFRNPGEALLFAITKMPLSRRPGPPAPPF